MEPTQSVSLLKWWSKLKPTDKLFAFMAIVIVALCTALINIYSNKEADKKTTDSAAQNSFNVQLQEQKNQTDYWKTAYHLKDSLYDDCGKQRYQDAKATDVSVNKSSELTTTIKTLSK